MIDEVKLIDEIRRTFYHKMLKEVYEKDKQKSAKIVSQERIDRIMKRDASLKNDK